MTSTYNSVVVLGVVADLPTLQYETSGVPFVDFSLTTKTDIKPGAVDVRIRAKRRLAELCAQFLVKGRQALVVGELSRDKESDLRVIAREVKFLSKEGKHDAL